MSAVSFSGALLLAGTVVLAVGWTGAYFLRRRAAWENALCRTVMLVLLVLPVAQLVGPRVFGPSRPEANRREEAASSVVAMTGSGLAGAGVETLPAAAAKGSDAWTVVWQGLLLTWGVGTLVSLAGLARSAYKVRRWVRAASPMAAGEERGLLADSARTAGVRQPDLRVAAGLHSPVLVGWMRPCILVPSPEVARQREVLLHELAHLRRADLWWMTLGRIVSAGWWFHPLAWSMGRRLERSAEDVCDDLVVIWTQDAAAYAGQLMRFAQQADGAGWWPFAGAAITGFRSELGKRVERMLEPGRALRVAIGRSAIVSLATGAAALLVLLAAATPIQGQNEAQPAQPVPGGQATPGASPVQAKSKVVAATNNQTELAAINHKLTSIIVPNLEFRRTTLSDGIEFLRQEARRLDTSEPNEAKRGINIVLAQSLIADNGKKRITITMERVPLIEALRQVARQAGAQVAVEPYLVNLVPAPAGAITPVPLPEVTAADKLRLAETQRKLDSIIIPNIEFRRTTIRDGIEFLRQEARRLDTDPNQDERGVNIVLNASVSNDKRVTLSLSNMPLLEALRYVASQTDTKVSVEPYAAVLEANNPE